MISVWVLDVKPLQPLHQKELQRVDIPKNLFRYRINFLSITCYFKHGGEGGILLSRKILMSYQVYSDNHFLECCRRWCILSYYHGDDLQVFLVSPLCHQQFFGNVVSPVHKVSLNVTEWKQICLWDLIRT